MRCVHGTKNEYVLIVKYTLSLTLLLDVSHVQSSAAFGRVTGDVTSALYMAKCTCLAKHNNVRRKRIQL
jgi:hypothetical protein